MYWIRYDLWWCAGDVLFGLKFFNTLIYMRLRFCFLSIRNIELKLKILFSERIILWIMDTDRVLVRGRDNAREINLISVCRKTLLYYGWRFQCPVWTIWRVNEIGTCNNEKIHSKYFVRWSYVLIYPYKFYLPSAAGALFKCFIVK